jgi:hypothetical protein
MKTLLQACGFWDVVEQDHNPQPLPVDPTLAQIRNHREERAKKFKAKHVFTLLFLKQYFQESLHLIQPSKFGIILKRNSMEMRKQSRCKS